MVRKIPFASCAAAPGATQPGAAVLRFATGGGRAAVAGAPAFVSVWFPVRDQVRQKQVGGACCWRRRPRDEDRSRKQRAEPGVVKDFAAQRQKKFERKTDGAGFTLFQPDLRNGK